jgi:TolB protein
MRAGIAGILLALAGVGPAGAVLTIRITEGQQGAQPIAVVPFGWEVSGVPPALDVAEVIRGDLARTGRFAPLPETDLPGRPREAAEVDFRDWRKLGSENLVVGRVRSPGAGQYEVQFQLFDVFKGTQLAGYGIDARQDNLRRTAHRIADIIYERLTGERGAFATRIAYVTEVRRGAAKRYLLQVADSDGHNAHTVLDSAQPILSPAWAPDGKRLAYVSFEGGRSAVYVQDLGTGQRESVAAHEGINSAPAWAPDGRRLALTLSRDGNPEIYVLDTQTRELRRVTDNPAIDTEPAWAPDGESLVFTSDRGGRPQIYRVAASGGAPRRVTFEGDYNARATFSPDGRRLALIHRSSGSFHIGLLDLDTGALRVLTDTRLDESPSFAPNGAMVLYATSGPGGGSLEAVSVDARVHQRLTETGGAVREPAWSPFLD